MNEDEKFIIDEDLDFDEEFSELEIKKSQYSFQQIKDILTKKMILVLMHLMRK